MILLELRDYLQQRQTATLAELALHFDMPESAVEPMMAVWVRKGVAQVQTSTSSCASGQCAGCQSQCTLSYRFADPAVIPIRSVDQS